MIQSSSVARRLKAIGWMAAIAGGLAAKPAAAATPAEVDTAVDNAVKYLYSQQHADGTWEAGGKPKAGVVGEGRQAWVHFGGETAAATYALLAAGENSTNPNLRKAIEWLESNDAHGTYVVGLRSGVWAMLPEIWHSKDKQFSLVRDHDRDFSMYSRIQRGKNMGFYSYVYGGDLGGSMGGSNPGGFIPYDQKGPPEGSGFDRSNSQYGVFAAWGTEQAGAEIPTQYWLDEDAAWKKAQNPDGGWDYGSNGEGSTYTMTCAGLATLFITQDYVLRTNSKLFDKCVGGVTNSNIEKGLGWMDKHIGQAMGTGGGWGYYGLYGIERVGVASGRKYFGPTDWYKTGANNLVKSQANGGWGGTIHDSAFATIFLCRGRAPVLMNKLLYTSAESKQTDPWNERPRDVANLAKWMGKHSLEGFLNWQIVNLQVTADDLHDAPILYISGSDELLLSNQDIEKLRLFVNQGGMLLGNADCGSTKFATSFKKLCKKLFTKYEFRRLPSSHPIFDEQYHAKFWKTKPDLEGISNGVRELAILIPEADPGKAWQTEATKVKEEAYQLGGNIFLYATGKENLTHKGDSYIVDPEGDAGKEIKIARIDAVDNNFDPEPGAWPRLSAIIHNERHMDLKPVPLRIANPSAKPEDPKLEDFKIAALTGTTRFKFNEAQRKAIKQWVNKDGGTLIIDAAGGSSEFADAVEAELNAIFGSAAAKGLAAPLPITNPIYTEATSKIEAIHYRSYARKFLTGSAHDPRVRGIATPDGRIGVYYSREDLTEGMLGEPVDGIIGYEPKVASQIMENIVLFADKGGVVEPPTSKPSSDPASPVAGSGAGAAPVVDAPDGSQGVKIKTGVEPSKDSK